MADENVPDDEECDLVIKNVKKRKRVNIEDEDGKVERYLLKEMMSDGVQEWMEFQANIIGTKNGRPDPKSANFKDFQAKLISLCLYGVEGNNKVPIGTIRGFTASTMSALYDECETMNGLNADGRDAAKKASPPTKKSGTP